MGTTPAPGETLSFTFDDTTCWIPIDDVVAALLDVGSSTTYGAAEHLLDAVGHQHPLPADLRACANAHRSPLRTTTSDSARESARARWAEVLEGFADRAEACECGRLHQHEFAAVWDQTFTRWTQRPTLDSAEPPGPSAANASRAKPSRRGGAGGPLVAAGAHDQVEAGGRPLLVAHFGYLRSSHPVWFHPFPTWADLRTEVVDSHSSVPKATRQVRATFDRDGHAWIETSYQPHLRHEDTPTTNTPTTNTSDNDTDTGSGSASACGGPPETGEAAAERASVCDCPSLMEVFAADKAQAAADGDELDEAGAALYTRIYGSAPLCTADTHVSELWWPTSAALDEFTQVNLHRGWDPLPVEIFEEAATYPRNDLLAPLLRSPAILELHYRLNRDETTPAPVNDDARHDEGSAAGGSGGALLTMTGLRRDPQGTASDENPASRVPATAQEAAAAGWSTNVTTGDTLTAYWAVDVLRLLRVEDLDDDSVHTFAALLADRNIAVVDLLEAVKATTT